ncbi:MAG: DUF433 domain-containing protein [Chloroflexi bacterium]|nr:DUF433 domain-containing protein [Chloroflexota bacterium]
MNTTIQISPETYKLLKHQARKTQSTPEQIAETVIRQQLGGATHIEQRQTSAGPQAYLRGTRVAVRHIATFLKAGYTVEEITQEALPHLPKAAIYEAIAWYYDHGTEINEELAANSEEAVRAQLRKQLSPAQYARLTGQSV